MDKVCLECGEKIIGRSDKKFCDDACRNAYNNNLNKASKNLVRNINNKLKKNYRILESLNPSERNKIKRNSLLRKGFDFEYFTSIYTNKKGVIYYFVYDNGYFAIEDDFLILVKKEL